MEKKLLKTAASFQLSLHYINKVSSTQVHKMCPIHTYHKKNKYLNDKWASEWDTFLSCTFKQYTTIYFTQMHDG